MLRKSVCFSWVRCSISVLVIALLMPAAWAKPKFKVLQNIPEGLWNGVSLDAKGNVWGVTSAGGYGYGSVFELTPQPGGKWKLITVHSFDGNTEGGDPIGTLIFDPAGNAYGTTLNSPSGGGMVYELTPGSNGWDLTVLHDFELDGVDGCAPTGLVMDAAGNLYGNGGGGGTNGFGVVFELSPGSRGWTEQVLYNFGAHGYDAIDPSGPLLLDKAGNVYGTASGGSSEAGTVFELKKASGWAESLLWQFDGSDGGGPRQGVVRDPSGSLYGTAAGGRDNDCYGNSCGVVFKLTRLRGGQWKEVVLYDFPNPANGYAPSTTDVAIDKAGNLYGATALGGNEQRQDGCGVVYELSPGARGKWKYTVLHKFNYSEGWVPNGGVALDSKGNLYGAAFSVVYEVTP